MSETLGIALQAVDRSARGFTGKMSPLNPPLMSDCSRTCAELGGVRGAHRRRRRCARPASATGWRRSPWVRTLPSRGRAHARAVAQCRLPVYTWDVDGMRHFRVCQGARRGDRRRLGDSRAPAGPRSDGRLLGSPSPARNAERSGGSGLAKLSCRPSSGCGRARRAACRNWRSRPSGRAPGRTGRRRPPGSRAPGSARGSGACGRSPAGRAPA